MATRFLTATIAGIAASLVLLGSASESSAQLARSNASSGVEPQSPVGTVLGSATLWAVINANGTVARSDGANTATTRKIPGFNGSYEVIFYRNVTGCVYTASIGNAGAGNPLHGSIVVAARAGNALGVFVETRTASTGALVDRPFHLFVNC
nr:hypothetical protein [Mesorhizobium sp.]